MKKIRLALWGVSGRGVFGRKFHRPDKGMEIVAGADISPENLQEFKEHFNGNVPVSENYRETLLMPDLDGVIICTPDFLHEEHAVAALEAGKTVYIEKPLAVTIGGCTRILETAGKNSARLFVGHNMRYFPAVIKMKEIIDSGVIGDIQAVWCRHFVGSGGDWYFKDWHSESRLSTGLLLQKASHDIDVIHWLAGGYTKKTMGMGKLSIYDQCRKRAAGEPGNPKSNVDNWPPLSQAGMSPFIDVEDHSMVMMELDNKVQASYVQCHYTPTTWRNYTFIGSRGMLENAGITGNCRINVFTRRSASCDEPDIVYQMKKENGGHGGSDPMIIDGFADYAINGKKPNTSPVAAWYAVATGVKATESLRNSHAMETIPDLPDETIKYFDD